MSKDKKSFLLYLDQKELFEKLPDETAGKLIKHIFKYVNCEDPETGDLLIDIAFSSIKQALKRDLKKWEAQTEQRRQAGLKSAESRLAKRNEKQRKPTSVESRSTKSTDSVNVSVNVSDNENNKDICAAFDIFWLSYPKKADRKKAENKFKLVVRDLKLKTSKELNDFSGFLSVDCKKRFANTEKQFVPLATTYLNGERWNDEL